MFQYSRLFALAVALFLLGGIVPVHAVGSHSESHLTAPLRLSAASLDSVTFLAVAPANHEVPLAVWNGQPAEEVLDTFELELAQIQLHFSLKHSTVPSPDRGFCSLLNSFAPSLVSQHVRLQI